MKHLILITAFSISLFTQNWAFAAATETKEFTLPELKNFIIENSAGEVAITGIATGKKVTVDYQKIRFTEKCSLEFNQKDNELRIVSGAKSMFTNETCEVKFKIKVPAAVNLRAKLGSGDLRMDDINGTVDFKIGSGGVLIQSVTGKIDGLSGSGKIRATGLAVPVSLISGSGGIELGFSSVPAWGELNLKSGSGDIELNFPPDAKFATDYWAGSGKFTNEFATVPEGPFKVIVKTGSGDLKIHKAKAKIPAHK